MKNKCFGAHKIVVFYMPIMLACFQCTEIGRASWSPASVAAAMCLPGGMNFRFGKVANSG
jgi:hypothetical protein